MPHLVSVQSGGDITISGNGFAASSALTATIDNVSVTANLSSDANGTFPVPLSPFACVREKHNLKSD
jgi:hypothetical protein